MNNVENRLAIRPTLERIMVYADISVGIGRSERGMIPLE